MIIRIIDTDYPPTMKYTFLLLTLITLFLTSCGEPTADLDQLDLMSYGMPLTIDAPAGAEVTKRGIAFRQELEIVGEDNFRLVVAMDDAVQSDAQKLKEQKLSEAKQNRFFFRLVEDDPQGFIFENRIDSVNSTYGFNYVKIQGDKEFVFQQSRTGIYSLEEVQAMYGAVRETEE